MPDFAAWLGIAIGVVALAIAYFAYRSQRGLTRLEYAVISNSAVVPAVVRNLLNVTFQGVEVSNASVVIIRIVSTGDNPILADDFNTSLAVELRDATEIIYATVVNTRPRDLRPVLATQGNTLSIAPLLINPTDMVEVQLLVSGIATDIVLSGRIAKVHNFRQRSLPYPPGTGPEGELTNGFEKFMLFGTPVLVAALFSVGILAASVSVDIKVGTVLLAVLLSVVVMPAHARYLIRRRKLWAP